MEPPSSIDLAKNPDHGLHHDWAKALGRFIDQNQVRIAHQRSADGQHLLLAS